MGFVTLLDDFPYGEQRLHTRGNACITTYSLMKQGKEIEKLFMPSNTQLVCDARCKIITVLAKFSGSCHDLFKLRQSRIG